MSATGVKAFTMAFMLSGGGCVPRWDSSRALTGGTDAATISAIKNAGGNVQISFGGWSGYKLGPNCSTSAAYASAVQQVINAYQPAAVDFDIATGIIAAAIGIVAVGAPSAGAAPRHRPG